MTLATDDRGWLVSGWISVPRRRVVAVCLAVGGAGLVATVVFPYQPLLPLLGLVSLAVARTPARPSRPMTVTCALLGVTLILGSIAMSGRYGQITSGRGTWDRPLGPGDTATWGDGTHITLSAPRPYTPSRAARVLRPDYRAYRFTVTVHNGGPTFLNLSYFHTDCLASGLDYPRSLLEVPASNSLVSSSPTGPRRPRTPSRFPSTPSTSRKA